MIQKNYSQLLHTKEWKEKRQSILIRDNFKCTCCHKEKQLLIVHHKYYKAYNDGHKVMPWEYDNDALVTLCYACHKKAHRFTCIPLRFIGIKKI